MSDERERVARELHAMDNSWLSDRNAEPTEWGDLRPEIREVTSVAWRATRLEPARGASLSSGSWPVLVSRAGCSENSTSKVKSR